MALRPLYMVLDHSIWYKATLTSERDNRRDKIPMGLFPRGQKKLEEEKNNSSTQDKGERREKNYLTTLESFWCE